MSRRYEIIKGAGRTMWCVRTNEDEDLMRFYSKRECEAWITRAEQADKEAAEWKIATRAYREAAVQEYLAERRTRTRLTQLTFEF